MEAKSLLRDSAHFRHISIFPNKPKWQRVHKANMRLVVKTLGTDKMFVKGSRVSLKDDENQWQHGGHHRGGRVGNTRGQGGRGGGRGRENQARGAPLVDKVVVIKAGVLKVKFRVDGDVDFGM